MGMRQGMGGGALRGPTWVTLMARRGFIELKGEGMEGGGPSGTHSLTP